MSRDSSGTPEGASNVEGSLHPPAGAASSGTGGATGSGDPLLPLRDEEDEDDEEEIKSWLVEIQAIERGGNNFVGLAGEIEVHSQEVEAAIFNVIESFKLHGVPADSIELGIEGSMAKFHESLGADVLDQDQLACLHHWPGH